MRAYKGVISIAPNSQSQTQRESYREREQEMGGGVGGGGGEVSDWRKPSVLWNKENFLWL